MMEAIQIGPVAFGPLPPGSGGGHGNTVARGISGLQDIFAKTKNVEMTAREGAQNTLTDLAEFKWGDVFMNFSYQRKGDKFFANGRPLEDINDPNEIGGDRMGRVMTALNQMAADKNIAEAIVVSEDLGYGRHFIYKYRRGENGDIEGLAFEYQGKEEELGSVVSELGTRAVNSYEIKNNPINFSVPLFFANENKNSVEDLARAAHNSFSSGERRRDMKKYLDRLNRDTGGFDELMHRRKMQEEELAKQFEKIVLSNSDAKAGIATAVYGAIDIARKMELREDRRREEVKPEVYHIKDIIRSFSYGLVAIPGLIDRTGRLLSQNETVNKLATETEEEAQEKDHLTSQIIEPVVAGVIGLAAVIISFPPEDLLDGQKPNEEENQKEIPKNNNDNVDELMFWQEIVSAIFESVDVENEVNIKKESEFILEETSFSEMLVRFIPRVHIEDMDKPLLLNDRREPEMLITDFQQGLEVIAGLIERRERNDITVSSEEKIKQKILEHEVVTLGRYLIKLFTIPLFFERPAKICKFRRGVEKPAPSRIEGFSTSSNNKPPEVLQQIETLGRIAFLLSVYEDPNSTELVKSFIGFLIYKQIQQFKENRLYFSEDPEIIDIFEKFDRLSPFTSFFYERFDLLLSVLQNLYPTINFPDEDLVGKLIFIIAMINKRQELFSFEKLKTVDFSNTANFFFRRRKNTKRKKHGIIYQYSPYLSQAVKV